MNRGENELLAEFYRNEQRGRLKALACVSCLVLFFVVMFLVGYFIK